MLDVLIDRIFDWIACFLPCFCGIGIECSALSLHNANGTLRYSFRGKIIPSFYNLSRSPKNRNMCIVGESGSGKSNAAYNILSSLRKFGANVLIIDPHAEYAKFGSDLDCKVYDASIFGTNLLDLDGLSQHERTGEVTSLLRKIFRLGDIQSHILYKALSYTYYVSETKGMIPRISSLCYALSGLAKKSGISERRQIESLRDRVTMLASGSGKTVNVEDLINASNIFVTSRLRTKEAHAAYVDGILRKIYSYMVSKGRFSKPLYIVIDEAENVVDSSTVSRIAAEGRKYNVGIVAISQRVKAIPAGLRSNSNMMFAFSQKEPEELNYIANLIAQGNEHERFIAVKKEMRKLRVGRCIVHESGKAPKSVRVYLKTATSLDYSYEIEKLAEKGIEKSALKSALKPEMCDFEANLEKLTGLGIVSRYVDGNELWYITAPTHSAEHDINVNRICKAFADSGIRSWIYNKPYGPDVVAYLHGKQIAIEYETGMKNISDTEKMINARLDKYAKVVVISKDTEFINKLNVISDKVIKIKMEALADTLTTPQFH